MCKAYKVSTDKCLKKASTAASRATTAAAFTLFVNGEKTLIRQESVTINVTRHGGGEGIEPAVLTPNGVKPLPTGTDDNFEGFHL
jgi:hypothetical protein